MEIILAEDDSVSGAFIEQILEKAGHKAIA